jgi:hypothetical protein
MQLWMAARSGPALPSPAARPYLATVTPRRQRAGARENEAEARQASVLTKDEARRINIARLPELLSD